MTLLRIISVVVVAAVVVVVTCLHQHDSNVSKDVYSDKRIIFFLFRVSIISLCVWRVYVFWMVWINVSREIG